MFTSERTPENLIENAEGVQIKISKKVKVLHPVAEAMARNLAEVEPIRFIRILPDLLEASSEATIGRSRIPITKPGHPSAIGISVILSLAHEEIQFFAVTSAKKGYGGRMVDAVLRALPAGWKAFVLMDWSDGFWEYMTRRYASLKIV
ncbi:MAG TPA: hypothetical protein VM123_21575 [archaeon]|nr:hypothetical protein [archaeon]